MKPNPSTAEEVNPAGSHLVAAVGAIYAAFGRGDIPAVLDGLAEDVTWTLHGPAGVNPLFGTKLGRQGVGQFFQKLNAEIEFWQFEPRVFTSNDTTVIVRLHFGLTIKRNGQQLDYDTIHVWEFAGGKVAAFSEFFDTAAYLSAYQK